MIDIQVSNTQTDLAIKEDQVQALVLEVLAYEGVDCQEVSICFVSVAEICQLHADFFDDPTQTDCISFPLDETESDGLDHRVLGEVFVCPATAIQYAAEHQLNAEEETSLYIIHGLLHLMGYDDLNEEDCLVMRSAEKRHFDHLKAKNLLLFSTKS